MKNVLDLSLFLFESEKYYLGKLCKYNHRYKIENYKSNHSIYFKENDRCLLCEKLGKNNKKPKKTEDKPKYFKEYYQQNTEKLKQKSLERYYKLKEMPRTSAVYLVVEVYRKNQWEEVLVKNLEKICILLGRNKKLSPDDVIIDDSIVDAEDLNKISSVHLTFYRRSQTEKEKHRYQSITGYSVKDGHGSKSSTNGSKINGKPLVEKVDLRNNDVIQIGKNIRVIYREQKDSGIATDLEMTLTDSEEI